MDLNALSVPQGVDISGGLKAFHALLRGFYSDVSFPERECDDQKYTDLISTMTFLHTIFIFGIPSFENSTHTITIDKAVLQKNYKKGNLALRQRHIEHHGLNLQYLNAHGQCDTLRKASHLQLSYTENQNLIPVVKAFADSAESYESSNDILYNSFGLFIKGDIEAALGAKSIRRSDLDPCQDDILRTVDSSKQAWIKLVNKLCSLNRLDCTGFMHYFASPSWSVSFAEKRKKPLAIFTLGSNSVFLEFTLPVNAAESIIRGRHTYSETINPRQTAICSNNGVFIVSYPASSTRLCSS